MADSENDSLSVEDLLSAFGAPSAKPRSEQKRASSPKKEVPAPSMNEDEIDLLSALGIPTAGMEVAPAKAKREAFDKSDRESFKDAARREQQIRAQQWQQELRRREARIARTQTANEEAVKQAQAASSSDAAGSASLPQFEEGGLSKKPSRPEFVEGGFQQPSSYAPRQIPEPSFLSNREVSAPNANAGAPSAAQAGTYQQNESSPASLQASLIDVEASGLQPFVSNAQPGFDGFDRRIIEPSVQQVESAIDVEGESFETAIPADLPSTTVDKEEVLQVAQADQVGSQADSGTPADNGVIKRSFFSNAAPMATIQRLDEAKPNLTASSTDAEEDLVERRQVPLSASTDALSTGMLGSIQPVPGGFAQSVAPSDADVSASQLQPSGQGSVSPAEPQGSSVSDGRTFESGIFEPVSAPVPVQDEVFQPVSSAAFGASDAMVVDQGVAAMPAQLVDQFGNPIPQDAFVAQQPMQPMQPMTPVAPGAMMPLAQEDQFDIEQQAASSRRNNILGIILIVVALLCAVMAIGMLSGLFNMNSSQSSSASSTAASSSAPISDAVIDPNTTQAVYTYVVRGVDGTTHEATETATFNADGFLEGSTIEINVDNADVANALLEQLKSEFGTSVVNSEADDNHVLIDLDINRDDLTKEAYTELLLANMTEFKQVS